MATSTTQHNTPNAGQAQAALADGHQGSTEPVVVIHDHARVPRWVESLMAAGSTTSVAANAGQGEVSLTVTETPWAVLVALDVDGEAVFGKPEYASTQIDQFYRDVLREVDRRKGMHLCRIWNHVPQIQAAVDGTLDRYMVFNQGRHAAFAARAALTQPAGENDPAVAPDKSSSPSSPGGQAGQAQNATAAPSCAAGCAAKGGATAAAATSAASATSDMPALAPAASGVAALDGRLVITALAVRGEVTHVENPRQRPAVHYSERFGPMPPCFSRASRLESLAVPISGMIHQADDSQPSQPVALISGTASIRGEQSVHVHNMAKQQRETLVNLIHILRAALRPGDPTAADPGTTKTGDTADTSEELGWLRHVMVYVNHPEHLDELTQWAKAAFCRSHTIEIAPAALCRPDLLLEVEGIAQLL